MKTFKKWNHVAIEDCGCYMSEEGKSYIRAFKSFLKRNFPGAELVGFNPNHYDTFGFLVIDGICVYVSHEIPRYGRKLDFSQGECCMGGSEVLYRTAKDTNDYRGDRNHFSSMFELVDNINILVGNALHGQRDRRF